MEKTKKGVGKKIVDIALWVFLGFAIAITVITLIANSSGKEYPVFGSKAYITVKTDSMNGEDGKGFKEGDLIICEELVTNEQKTNLAVGDVITFRVDLDITDDDYTKELNTHRIVNITTTEDGVRIYKTKGDANLINDEYNIYDTDIVLKWTGKKVAVLGSVLAFLSGSTGFLIFVVIPMCLFFIYELVNLFIQIDHMKHEKATADGDAKAISEEEEAEIKRRAIEEYLAEQEAKKKK